MKVGAPAFNFYCFQRWQDGGDTEKDSVGAGLTRIAGSRVSLDSRVTIDGNIVLGSSFSLHNGCKFSRVNHFRLLPSRNYFC